MKVTITGFHQDEEEYWVADLSCGHSRHFRHNPPWQEPSTSHHFIENVENEHNAHHDFFILVYLHRGSLGLKR